MIHLIDGTYELFRHFYGLRRFNKGKDTPLGAVAGVLGGVLHLIEEGATHLGVATDHVIESFRNELWPGYKTGEGIERALRAQFTKLEAALEAMGIKVWPMVQWEADDALAAAAKKAAANAKVKKVCIWSPDKDLAQCVQGERVVQVDSKRGTIRDEAAVLAKFGVKPGLIPDYLALVGDAADGYPGIAGIGATGAAKLLNQYGPMEKFPKSVLGAQRSQARLFKKLATLVTDVPVFNKIDELQWRGPTPAFSKWLMQIGSERLKTRVEKATKTVLGTSPG